MNTDFTYKGFAFDNTFSWYCYCILFSSVHRCRLNISICCQN